MELLKQRILQDGRATEDDVLKVDSFLNHQMDISLLNEIGKEFRRRFAGEPVTKILTIEASGIGIAAIVAQHFGNVPVVFAKKTQSRNLDGALYTARVQSFTKGTVYDIQVSRKFLGPQDCVLILDDFLARGQALQGLLKIVKDSGAKLAGCGIVIEKGFQDGGRILRAQGVRVESLAIVSSISGGKITFAE
ncbi:MAG TPA: xanthine phosphoribosyltransferase [Firmicutes bacterium]|nr:xanthine phosphoribosyltransferase [Bacillota bacterium]